MKSRRSKIQALLILFGILLITAILLRHEVAAQVIGRIFAREAGFTAKMTGVHVSLFTPDLTIEKIEILNPAGYVERQALLIEQFQCRYQRGSLLRGNANLDSLHLKLANVNGVKSKDGTLNLEKLDQWIKVKLDKKELQIHDLKLSLVQAHYLDESTKNDPLVFECNPEEHTFKIETSADFQEAKQKLMLENSLNNLGAVVKGVLQKIGDLFK